MHNGIVNKTRYDDLRKPMKQTSFTVKNLGGNLLKKQFTIVKRSFKSSTKPLSLDSTISIDELTTKTFYDFRTSKFFNIWTPPFCTDPSTWLTHQLEEDVGYKVFHFINNEDQEALGYKTLRRKRCSSFFQREYEIGHLLHMFSLYFLMWRPLK